MMRYVLVTGAGGGMGRAAVRMLAAQGRCVFAMDKTPPEGGDRVIPIAADVTDEATLQAAAETVRAVTPRLDAIVHFAGIYRLDSLVEMSGAALEEIFAVNVLGAAAVNRVFVPFLAQGGRIVAVTSELAPLDPLPFTGVYAVTKAALDKYAYALRMELQLSGIAVSVLRAGAVDTGMLPASTAALDRFCDNTQRYRVSADRFRRIVARVEARCVPPERVARKVLRILAVRRPRFAYWLNRNPLLLLLSAMPHGAQCAVIRWILR